MLLKLVELMRPWWSQVVTNQLPPPTSIIINRTQHTQQSGQNWTFQGDTIFCKKPVDAVIIDCYWSIAHNTHSSPDKKRKFEGDTISVKDIMQLLLMVNYNNKWFIGVTDAGSWSPNSTDLYFWSLFVNRQIQKT